MGRIEALRSLRGLSVGDAYGQSLLLGDLGVEPRRHPGGWPWTDDTHMALSILEVLESRGRVDQDALAAAFARRFDEEPTRGYAMAAGGLLARIHEGESWPAVAASLFGGLGSYGNGAAMRAAPLGAWFAGQLERAAEEGARSAAVTHAHVEGRAGAVAVAVAGALLAAPPAPTGGDLLREVAALVPESRTRAGIETAARLGDAPPEHAAERLGTGREISSQDTVPFCLWAVARDAGFEDTLTMACRPYGDRDTVGAIVGGLVVLSHPDVPEWWLRMREPLPPGFEEA